MKRLYRSRTDKKLAGVCGGLATYFNVDPTLIRAGYLLFSVFSAGFPGLLAYIVLYCIMPEEPDAGQPWQQGPPPNDHFT